MDTGVGPGGPQIVSSEVMCSVEASHNTLSGTAGGLEDRTNDRERSGCPYRFLLSTTTAIRRVDECLPICSQHLFSLSRRRGRALQVLRCGGHLSSEDLRGVHIQVCSGRSCVVQITGEGYACSLS